jgi:hypothetical protein
MSTTRQLDLWIFEDRASFLHLDELLAKHHQLGVDVFYSCSLLPVLLQHMVFLFFGRSFRPMLGCSALVLVLSAIFWARLLEHLPPQRRWLASVIALSPTIVSVNPVWPYSLAVLSILFALLFVLEDRLDIAFAVSAVGCFCVPSITLVLTLLIAFIIVVNWRLGEKRNLSQLANLLTPGLLAYMGVAALLSLVYGYRSLAATALPLAGAKFYKEIGYVGFSAFSAFFFPKGDEPKYYLAYYTGSPITWFIYCSIFLFGLSMYFLRRPLILRGHRFRPRIQFVVIYSIIQFILIFLIYGARGQHSIYDGALAAATLVGISTLPPQRHRNLFFAVFVATGFLGGAGTAYKALRAGRTTAPSPGTFGLYAIPGFSKELAGIVEDSKSHKTLFLGYATGIHNYYPTIEEPDAWFLQKGQLFPAQKQAIVDQIKHADVVVENVYSPSGAVSSDPNIQAALNGMHLASPKIYFRLHMREQPNIIQRNLLPDSTHISQPRPHKTFISRQPAHRLSYRLPLQRQRNLMRRDGALTDDHPGVAAAREIDDSRSDGAGSRAAVNDKRDLVA